MVFSVRFVFPKHMFMKLNHRVEGLIAVGDGRMLGIKRKYNRNIKLTLSRPPSTTEILKC